MRSKSARIIYLGGTFSLSSSSSSESSDSSGEVSEFVGFVSWVGEVSELGGLGCCWWYGGGLVLQQGLGVGLLVGEFGLDILMDWFVFWKGSGIFKFSVSNLDLLRGEGGFHCGNVGVYILLSDSIVVKWL